MGSIPFFVIIIITPSIADKHVNRFSLIRVIKLLMPSSVKVRVLCHGRGMGGGSLSLIGQKFKMADGKQSSDWTTIQDGNSACDLTRIQDGE